MPANLLWKVLWSVPCPGVNKYPKQPISWLTSINYPHGCTPNHCARNHQILQNLCLHAICSAKYFATNDGCFQCPFSCKRQCSRIPRNSTVRAQATWISVLPIILNLVPSIKIDANSKISAGVSSKVPWWWKNNVWVCPVIFPCLNPSSVLCQIALDECSKYHPPLQGISVHSPNGDARVWQQPRWRRLVSVVY